MAAIIRLKRHLDEEPLSALILSKKRKKCDEKEKNNEVSKVLTFAGTINNQNDDISSHINKINKENLEKSYKRHVPNITSKLKQQTKTNSEENRLKIVNLCRSIDKEVEEKENETSEISPDKLITVLDVESGYHTSNETNKDESNYVYDLYYTNSDDLCDTELDSEYVVVPANEIVFDNDLPNEDSDHDSEDSNDENNWRNDYPDEDDEESIDENDMRLAIEDMSLGDLSSDDNEPNGFMYSIDSEAVNFEEDLDHTDSRRYGELYARFKIRQKHEEERYNRDLYHDEVDDTDDDYYD